MNGIQKLTRNRRVASAAAKRAHSSGVPVTAKSLRVWLSRADTAQQLRLCTEHALEQAARQLTYVIPGGEAGQRQTDALLVLQIVMEEYVGSAGPSEASLVTGDWGQQTTREDGAKTREQVGDLRENLLGRLDVRTDFDEALRTLSPWSAQEARRLRPAWPAVERAVGILTGVEAARGPVIQQWANHEPGWMAMAPAEALGWLGQLAADYGARGASHVFFERCAREGGYPRDFFVARAATHAGSGTEQEVRDYLAAHHDATSPLLNGLRACLDEDWAEGIAQLGRWEPHHALAQAMKAQFEAEVLIKTGRPAEALAKLRPAGREGMFAGVAVSLASALLHHAVHSRTSNRLAAGQEALAVAVRARNGRRVWHGDSAEPAVLAVQAAVLSGDLSTAWKLTQPEPEGEAQPQEAADNRMREQTALVAAMTGRQQEAEQLLAAMTTELAGLLSGAE